VELNEFEIAHLGAGLPGHRHPPVAGGLGRVGGFFLEQVGRRRRWRAPRPWVGRSQRTCRPSNEPAALAQRPVPTQSFRASGLALPPERRRWPPARGVHHGLRRVRSWTQHPAVAVGGLQGGAQTSMAAMNAMRAAASRSTQAAAA